MIATTLEQSRKLVELGIAPSTADMHYAFSAKGGVVFQDVVDASATLLPGATNRKFPYEPTWSLSALLDMLPHTITTDEDDEYILEMYKEYNLSYVIRYVDTFEMHQIVEFNNQEFIDAAFDAVVWLKENKYL